MNLIRIAEGNDFVVDYDKDRGMYRVSVFEDCHFKDEFWFDAYEEKELSKINNNEIDVKCCLFCANSLSADSIYDGSHILVCFNCHGMENKEVIVNEDGYCRNYN